MPGMAAWSLKAPKYLKESHLPDKLERGPWPLSANVKKIWIFGSIRMDVDAQAQYSKAHLNIIVRFNTVIMAQYLLTTMNKRKNLIMQIMG